ncbi:hypothetical protein BSCG_05730 [Bacteroides sp. 2_2_4]|nr:hypothetical protein BSCG_05730 [Bacteroides sp. 2_2_4]
MHSECIYQSIHAFCLIKQSPKHTSNKSRNPIFTSKIYFLLNVRGVSYKPTLCFFKTNRTFH